jgi:hypothetical protein
MRLVVGQVCLGRYFEATWRVGNAPLVRLRVHTNSWVKVPAGQSTVCPKLKVTASSRDGVGSNRSCLARTPFPRPQRKESPSSWYHRSKTEPGVHSTSPSSLACRTFPSKTGPTLSSRKLLFFAPDRVLRHLQFLAFCPALSAWQQAVRCFLQDFTGDPTHTGRGLETERCLFS